MQNKCYLDGGYELGVECWRDSDSDTGSLAPVALPRVRPRATWHAGLPCRPGP
jgi:hypothetical protein